MVRANQTAAFPSVHVSGGEKGNCRLGVAMTVVFPSGRVSRHSGSMAHTWRRVCPAAPACLPGLCSPLGSRVCL